MGEPLIGRLEAPVCYAPAFVLDHILLSADPKRISVVAAINVQNLKTCDAAGFAQHK